MKRGNGLIRLLSNSRFWILASAVSFSVLVAGIIQFIIPAGSLQVIRIEQTFGFIALALLYSAIIISPLTKVFPKLPGQDAITHARRAIGVSAFYYAFLHAWLTFFGQMGAFAGLTYLNQLYSFSLLLGVFALSVLCIMAATSFDWVVSKMGYKHWKLLHRLVYFASLALLAHMILIGTHFNSGITVLEIITYIAATVFVVLEVVRIRIYLKSKKATHA